MHRPETDILLNTFLMKKKRYRVLLNFNTIIWEKETNAKGTDKTVISVSDIISIQKSSDRLNDERTRNIDDENSLHNSTSPVAAPSISATEKIRHFLVIHYAKRIIKSSQDCNRWRKQTVFLQNSDIRVVTHWYGALQKIIKEQKRIENILVFINPFGGQKRGLVIYEKYCKPLFQLANIDASCIISQRPNQIHDIMMTHNLNQYDAVCCVGGDGTFAEVVNGLMFRTIKDLHLDARKPEFIPKPRIPVAIIPAGSTDTVAFSLHGTHDVVTAAIHIVLGQKRGLDISSIQNSNGLIRFCASVMSYGYLGDVALHSEKYRWMGTKRYEYTGFKSFLVNTGYLAEVRILLSDPDIENSTKLDLKDSIANSTSGIGEKCFVNCQRCSSASFVTNKLDNMQDSSVNPTSSKLVDGIGNKPISNIPVHLDGDINVKQVVVDTNYQIQKVDTCDNLKKMSDHNLSVIEKHNEFYENSYDSSKEAATSSTNESAWKVIKGAFFMISGANITCACSRSPNGISKYCHLGDGSIDLILVSKTTFLNNVRLLINMVNRNGDIRDLPFVEVYRTKKFCFRAQQSEEYAWDGSCHPINEDAHTKTSQWNCDGEVIHDLEIIMSCHCQLLDVLMRGPFPFCENSMESCCTGFCKP